MTVSADESTHRASRSWWAGELTATLRLGWPMALTQIGQVAMMTTDLALIGRLGDAALAGAALGHIMLYGAFMIGLGVVSAVSTLAAQAVGSRQPRLVRRAARVGLWAATLLAAPLTIVLLFAEPILVKLGQPQDASRLAGDYLAGLSWSLAPAWGFIAIRNFMGALGRPEPALWITLAAVPANAALAAILIFGWGPVPALSIVGAGIATTIVAAAMCIAALVVAHRFQPFRKFHLLGNVWRPDWPLLARLFALGLPITGAFLLEYSLFAAAGLLAGWIGKSALAAHQIALQIVSILFMVPFGLAMAATVRVGHAIGRNDRVAARRAGLAALAIAGAFMAAMALAVALGRGHIPHIFLDATAPENRATVVLTTTLLLLGASFAIADGLQTVAAGALRGLGDTRVPMLMAMASFWAIGLTATVVLAFPAALGAAGIWIGLTLALTVYATLLSARFLKLTRPGA